MKSVKLQNNNEIMKQTIKRIFILFVLFLIVGFCLYQVQTKVLAEQSGSSPESGTTSRLKSTYDAIVMMGQGSNNSGDWGDWGVYWNRVRSATYDYSTQSKVVWDDYKNGVSADGDTAGEESNWTNTSGNADTGVWKDGRTGLYWSANLGNNTNQFIVSSCDYFTSSPRSTYSGGDSDCGNAINVCANLSLDATGDGNAESDWYLPSQKELIQVFIDGMYNTNITFSTELRVWSSTELSSDLSNVWFVNLSSGHTTFEPKNTEKIVKCVRRD